MSDVQPGTRCLTVCRGAWAHATVARVNEDGTFDITHDGERGFLATWLGVTRDEMSFDGQKFERAPGAPMRFYWNQIRMGGRPSSEVSRPVTLADTLDALALADVDDPDAVAALAAHEQRLGLALPEDLRVLGTRVGARQAFIEGHPNAPNFVAIHEWARAAGPEADFIIVVAPHQGDHLWGVEVPRDGRPSGRVFVLTIDETATRVDEAHYTAESFAFFAWDLAQTGLVWSQSTNYNGGRPFRRTDIGVAPTGPLTRP